MKIDEQMPSKSYEKRSLVLKLLDHGYESYSEANKAALHYNLMWTMDALETVGLMKFVRQSDEVT